MLEQVGEPGFTRCSTLLYGRPDLRYRSQEANNADAAQDMLRITTSCSATSACRRLPATSRAEEFAVRLRERMAGFFTRDKVQVVLDPALASKATAGSSKVRLRANAAVLRGRTWNSCSSTRPTSTPPRCSTARHQPCCKSLGVGAPRTTRTQEGPGDLSPRSSPAHGHRALRRIALRVLMVGKGR
jgi:hypothetical protein